MQRILDQECQVWDPVPSFYLLCDPGASSILGFSVSTCIKQGPGFYFYGSFGAFGFMILGLDYKSLTWIFYFSRLLWLRLMEAGHRRQAVPELPHAVGSSCGTCITAWLLPLPNSALSFSQALIQRVLPNKHCEHWTLSCEYWTNFIW